jgi:hypothetical protein
VSRAWSICGDKEPSDRNRSGWMYGLLLKEEDARGSLLARIVPVSDVRMLHDRMDVPAIQSG